MMPRARRHDPTIPAHIDQKAIPAGVYWDRSGKGRWFRFVTKDGKPKRETLAGREAKLSELHAMVESANAARGTVAWVLGEFHDSTDFRKLAAGTKRDYGFTRTAVETFPTKLGLPLGKLKVALLSRTVIQRIVEKIAKGGHPTKANKVLRYLRRCFSWGCNHLGLKDNPGEGVTAVQERQRRRLPSEAVYAAVRDFAQRQGALKAHTQGSVAPYLWIVMELSYLLRLRGIETITLTEASADAEGIQTNRRKRSRDNVVEWNPRLRAVWDAALLLRKTTMERKRTPEALRPQERIVFVAQDGNPLSKSGLDTAWQRLMAMGIREGVWTADQRFGLHDLKRKGGTDTAGNSAEKRDALGVTEAMMPVYDHSVPRVKPSA